MQGAGDSRGNPFVWNVRDMRNQQSNDLFLRTVHVHMLNCQYNSLRDTRLSEDLPEISNVYFVFLYVQYEALTFLN